MKITLSVCITTFTFCFLLSCGDSTGPAGPDISPSVLSVTFTGQTGKSISDESSEPLSAVVLSQGGFDSPKSSCVVTAFWSICSDHDFHSYILYRSETPNIQSDPSSAEIIAEITSANTNLFVDEGVTWSTDYYYALKTADEAGNGVWSNEAPITTPAVNPPDPSLLTNVDASWDSAELSWTKCPNPNFESYRIYRSLVPHIEDDSTLAELVTEITWSLDTAYTDTSLTFSTTYYYALLTSNTENLSAWSNEITVNTMNNIPDEIIATVNAGSDPWNICSLPSGDYVYVTNRGDDNVSVIRTADNSVTATVSVGENPYGISALPSGAYVYVTNWGTDNVSVLRTSDNSVVATVSVGHRPVGICALPSGEYVYVTNRDDNNVSVIRTSDNTEVATINVGTTPYRICALPSGDYVYITNWGSDDVSVIRTSDNTVVDTVDMFTNPIGISAQPSGDYVFVSNYGNDLAAVIRTSDNSVVETIDIGNGPWGICMHPSGECLYVANSIDNSVSIVRTSDYKVLETVWVGSNPSSVCSLPSGDAVYVVNYNDDTVSVMQ
jgi:YVTN family beta-propeller protein